MPMRDVLWAERRKRTRTKAQGEHVTVYYVWEVKLEVCGHIQERGCYGMIAPVRMACKTCPTISP